MGGAASVPPQISTSKNVVSQQKVVVGDVEKLASPGSKNGSEKRNSSILVAQQTASISTMQRLIIPTEDLPIKAKFDELLAAEQAQSLLSKEGVETLARWILLAPDNDFQLDISEDAAQRVLQRILDAFKGDPFVQMSYFEFKEMFDEMKIRSQLNFVCDSLFQEIDINNNGYLERSEMTRVLDSLLTTYVSHGCTQDNSTCIKENFLNKFDMHGETKITRVDFQLLFDEIVSELNLILAVNEKFKQFDVDNNGFLEAEELETFSDWVLRSVRPLGAVISSKEREEMKQKILWRAGAGERRQVGLADIAMLMAEVIEERNLRVVARSKFQELDRDQSGNLVADEIVAVAEWVVTVLRSPESVEEVKKRILKEMDSNHDQQLDIDEFSTLFTDVMKRVKLLDKARAKFAEFDSDGGGKLAQQEANGLCDWIMQEFHLRSASMAPSQRDEYRATLMRMIDRDGDNTITLDEFAVYFDKVCALKAKKRRKSMTV